MRIRILASLAALLIAVQACCCCSILEGPQPPYTITPSDQIVRDLQERLDAIEMEQDGSFHFTITDEEITSLAVQRIAEQGMDLPVENLQLFFRNGRIEAYFSVRFGASFALPSMVAFSLDAVEGQVKVTIEEIAVGPLPVPQAALESLTNIITEMIAGLTVSEGAPIEFEDFQIGEGQMTIYGKIAATPSD